MKEASPHGLRPDISVHIRGELEPQNNILVVEVKIGRVRLVDFEDACIRLNEFTSGRQQVKYQFGTFIAFGENPDPIRLYFQNGIKPLDYRAH